MWGSRARGRRALLFAAAWGALGAGALLVVPRDRPPGRGGRAVGGAAFGRARDAADARRAAERGQRLRVAALERSLELRDASAASAAGELDGAVVAGLYRIGARMGAGASGVIYEGVRITDGLPVAVKLLRAASAHDAVASDRLRREAEALGLAWHPNVVESIDHGVLPDGSSYLVLERLEGETLASRLTARGRLAFDETLRSRSSSRTRWPRCTAGRAPRREAREPLPRPRRRGARGERVKLSTSASRGSNGKRCASRTSARPWARRYMALPEQRSGGEVDARSGVRRARRGAPRVPRRCAAAGRRRPVPGGRGAVPRAGAGGGAGEGVSRGAAHRASGPQGLPGAAGARAGARACARFTRGPSGRAPRARRSGRHARRGQRTRRTIAIPDPARCPKLLGVSLRRASTPRPSCPPPPCSRRRRLLRRGRPRAGARSSS